MSDDIQTHAASTHSRWSSGDVRWFDWFNWSSNFIRHLTTSYLLFNDRCYNISMLFNPVIRLFNIQLRVIQSKFRRFIQSSGLFDAQLLLEFNAQYLIVTEVPSIIVILKVYSLFNCYSTIVKMSKFRSYCSNSENCSSLLTQWCRSIVICQHAKVRTLKLLIINCRY